MSARRVARAQNPERGICDKRNRSANRPRGACIENIAFQFSNSMCECRILPALRKVAKARRSFGRNPERLDAIEFENGCLKRARY